MIECLHNYLLKELENCHRKETIYLILAVVFFLIEWIMNIYLSNDIFSYNTHTLNINRFIIFAFSAVMTIIFNGILVIALCGSYKTRKKIKTSLSALYSDNGLDKYMNNVPIHASKLNPLPILLIVALTIFVIAEPLLSVFLQK